MKRTKLLADGLAKALWCRFWSSRFGSALPAWLLLVCVFLPCACDGGRDNGQEQNGRLQEVVDKLAAIQTQLEQNGRRVHSHRSLSKEQLREVFQPLGDVLAQVVEQQQLDRQQWLAMVADVRRLSQVVAVGVAQKDQAELAAMRRRLDQIDARLRAQDQRSRDTKAALIQALDAAGSRLDGLLKELDTAPPEPKVGGGKGAGKGAGEGKGTGEGKGEPVGPAEAEGKAEGSSYAFLVSFLAISLVLLVGLVVFFPNRLRPVVPQIKYTARPDMASATASGFSSSGSGSSGPGSAGFGFSATGLAGAESIPSTTNPSAHNSDSNGGYLEGDSAAGAPELDHVEAAEAQVKVEARVKANVEAEVEAETDGNALVAEADLATSNGPGPDVVQLEVACDDPETAAARIAGFLAAEPRVLLHPAPDLQAHQDTLVLRFYLVPAVAAEQQSRIKAAIQGLAAEPALSSAAAGEPADMDNDVPAA